MAADVATSLKDVSTTAASNQPDGTDVITAWAENMRTIQAVMRQPYAQDTIASAGTMDIGAKDAGILTVTGSATVTSLGTVSAGITKWLIFPVGVTLTHNGTSLDLPGNTNITTAAGDRGLFMSNGSGNWVCLTYVKDDGTATYTGASTVTLNNIIAATTTNSINNGIYAQTWNWALTGAQIGYTITENTASTGGSATGTGLPTQALMIVKTATGSTAPPFYAQWDSNQQGQSPGAIGFTHSGNIELRAAAKAGVVGKVTVRGSGTNLAATAGGVELIGGASTLTGGSGGSIDLTAGAASGAGASVNTAGSLTFTAGSATGGTGSIGGSISLIAGSAPSAANDGYVTITGAVRMNSGRPPTLTSGFGTGAALVGGSGDTAALITIGTSASATMVFTFGRPWATNAPAAVVTSSRAGVTFSVTSSVTALTIVASSALSSADQLHIHCFGV